MNIWEKKYRRKGFKSQREYPNEFLIAFVKTNFKTNDKILELGCGSGANLWFLAREGYDTYGIDYSPTGIKFCRGKLKKENVKANIKVEDIRNLSFKDNFFDGIVDIVSLQHIKKKPLAKIYKCLKPRGKFFSYHLFKGDTDKLFNCKFYPLGISKKDLKKVGFKNITINKNIKTYNNDKYKMIYSIINAQK